MSQPVDPTESAAAGADSVVTDGTAASDAAAQAAAGASANAGAASEAGAAGESGTVPSDADAANAAGGIADDAADSESDSTEGDSEPAAKTVEDELAEMTEDLKRVSAEFANYRKRADRERLNTIAFARAQVATDLLPIADDIDLAEQHGDLADGPLKAFADKFRQVLTGLGVEKFGATGDEFDPEKHEAVQDTSSGDAKALGTVLRPGYVMGERVLRTAMVIIADPE